MSKDSSADKVGLDEERLEDSKRQALANNVQARYVLLHCLSALNWSANDPWRLQNPLRDIPRATLLKQVEAFVEEKGLQDKTDLFKKAAVLAQNPKLFEELDVLTEEDRAIIRRETTRQFLLFFPPKLNWRWKNLVDKWHQPRDLYLTVVICSLAAAVQ